MTALRSARVFRTALGWCAVAVQSGRAVRIVLPRAGRAEASRALGDGLNAGSPPNRADAALLPRAVRALRRYFRGEEVELRLPFSFARGTRFQRAVWRQAMGIGRGELRSYGELAARIGKPRAARAVGQALAANPLPLIVPCHRVVAGDGTLGGFLGGHDAQLKRRLLELDGLRLVGGRTQRRAAAAR